MNPPGASGIPRGAAAPPLVACPHEGQKAAVSATCAPHFEQNITPPHWPKKRIPRILLARCRKVNRQESDDKQYIVEIKQVAPIDAPMQLIVRCRYRAETQERKEKEMIKLDHAKVAVKNWRTSRDWYMKNLGLKLEFEAPSGGPNKLGIAALQDDAGFTLFLEQVAEPIAACDCVHNFQVDDVETKHRELSASGVKFIRALGKQFWGYGAELADPDGHVIYLWDERSMREKGGG